MNVVIAGAGIGGLTAALTLHARGIGATVLESARELRPLGVGINLQPRAVAELIELGLGDELAAIGIATAELAYCDETGRRLFTEPRGLAGGYRWPGYSVHRGRLQLMLLDAARDRLGANAVRTGSPVVGFEQDRGKVRVQLPGEAIDGDVLVGADGIHSVVRAKLHPEEGPFLWSGVQMWRGTTETPPFLDGRTMVIVRDREAAELVAYPIGPSTVNWVVLARTGDPGPLPGDASWNRTGRLEDVLKHVGDWRLGWLDVPWLVENSEQILEYPMVDRDPLPHWGCGRVTLLGDAAHPMYPVGANGGSQAILDARALADSLPDGLAAYEKTRRAATAAVVAANREMQRSGNEYSAARLEKITSKYRRDTGADG
ncbi:FAD-dependent monooxygenase [Fodinicola acaciae]|uniref:FAD-dependent monooxygenase n=1 Tax=Fodinicola acaciae TaxID=2681555 RepID=UPI0013D7DC12|nr:FAD-dependent monooxygenase [Fodinicola acaciae]